MRREAIPPKTSLVRYTFESQAQLSHAAVEDSTLQHPERCKLSFLTAGPEYRCIFLLRALHLLILRGMTMLNRGQLQPLRLFWSLCSSHHLLLNSATHSSISDQSSGLRTLLLFLTAVLKGRWMGTTQWPTNCEVVGVNHRRGLEKVAQGYLLPKDAADFWV